MPTSSRFLKPPLSAQGNNRRGFTLLEIMIASAIALVIVAGVTQMTLSIGKVIFDSAAKLHITRDVRVFTQQLSRDAWSARDYRVFTSTADLTRRHSGETGDVLALVWVEPESIETATAGAPQEYFYERIVVYARDTPVRPQNQRRNTANADENKVPVLRFERRFALPSATEPGTRASQTTIRAVVADILNPDNRDGETIVVELARGLADQRLFFNSRIGRSITINGEIYHGNRAREVSNTYNFTIHPRG
ncbi:MAG: prepilin-type N-terminal cleavage/methylation domain-containing protein [Opitutales bacterium]|nr:prepilin-type N-terminal cleavage/methylation domain-containing protein [Opitutales bacterium]